MKHSLVRPVNREENTLKIQGLPERIGQALENKT